MKHMARLYVATSITSIKVRSFVKKQLEKTPKSHTLAGYRMYFEFSAKK